MRLAKLPASDLPPRQQMDWLRPPQMGWAQAPLPAWSARGRLSARLAQRWGLRRNRRTPR
jgi:hypothetical protein